MNASCLLRYSAPIEPRTAGASAQSLSSSNAVLLLAASGRGTAMVRRSS